MIKTLTETECLLKLERPRFTFTANGRFKSRISKNRKQADKNCPEQFLRIKLAGNDLFLSRNNKQYTTIKGKTWSRGTNSRLPFGVNVNLNFSINESPPTRDDQV